MLNTESLGEKRLNELYAELVQLKKEGKEQAPEYQELIQEYAIWSDFVIKVCSAKEGTKALKEAALWAQNL